MASDFWKTTNQQCQAQIVTYILCTLFVVQLYDAHSVSDCFALFSDHCSTGRDATKREGVRGSPEETRPHPTAAIQVPAQRTARGPELNTSCRTGRDIHQILIVTDDWLLLTWRATRHWLCNCQVIC